MSRVLLVCSCALIVILLCIAFGLVNSSTKDLYCILLCIISYVDLVAMFVFVF